MDLFVRCVGVGVQLLSAADFVLKIFTLTCQRICCIGNLSLPAA